MTTNVLTIIVKYSCALCCTNDCSVRVPARETPEHDLMEWMNQTARQVSKDHRTRSPLCRARVMDRLMIPVEGVEWVGGPVIE